MQEQVNTIARYRPAILQLGTFIFMALCPLISVNVSSAQNSVNAATSQLEAGDITQSGVSGDLKCKTFTQKAVESINGFSKQFAAVEVQIEGGQKLNRSELERMLPEEQNLLSWKMSQDDLRAKFLAHPLVKDVDFGSCKSGQGFECLQIKIFEQQPRLWVRTTSIESLESETTKLGQAKLDKTGQVATAAEPLLEHRYLVAADGRIMAAMRQAGKVDPFTGLDREILGKFSVTELSDLPVLDMRNLTSVSDVSSRIFSKAVDVLSLVENAFSQKVYQMKFLSDGEVEADFEMLPYSVVFSLGSGFNNKSLLALQVQRLHKVLKEKPVLATRASRITLGSSKEVVVVLS